MRRIAIVGAGPAGSYLAWRLANTELEILLFDPRIPGYEKPCGGGLSPLVGRRFPDVMALPFPRHQAPYVQLRSGDGSQVEYPLSTTDWAITSRVDFGRALLERAMDNSQARHIRQRVTGLERVGERWSVLTRSGEELAVDFVVGADGVHSIVRRQVVGRIPRQHLGLAVGYRVQGAPDKIVFQTYSNLEGYLWSFPRSDHASVGICGRLSVTPARDLWRQLDTFLAETCPEAVKLDHYTALLPMARGADLWDTPCAGPEWALLGDAAGHVHPLTGEGIAYALWSADLLANALSQGEPMTYKQMWREQYGNSFFASSRMLSATDGIKGAYEVAFQLAMAVALRSSG